MHAPLQAENPLLQVKPHTPPLQLPVPLAGAVHLLLQAPQLFTSVLMLVLQPCGLLGSPQLAKPVVQWATQPPFTQVGLLLLLEHANCAPQPPQWVGSAAVLVSHPSTAVLLQSVKPGTHATMVQAPLTHASVEVLGRLQTLPH